MDLQHDPPESAAERIYVIGGTAIALAGIFNRSTTGGLGLMLLGGALVAKGIQTRQHNLDLATGSVEPVMPQNSGLVIERTLIVDRPRAQVYAIWRNLEGLARFSDVLDSVREHGEGRSTWIAKGPKDASVTWDAQIMEDRPNEVLAWRTSMGSAIRHEGAVYFHQLPGDRTEVRLFLDLHVPLGAVGIKAATWMGEDPEVEIDRALARFKEFAESASP